MGERTKKDAELNGTKHSANLICFQFIRDTVLI